MRRLINKLMIGVCLSLGIMPGASAGNITSDTFEYNTQDRGTTSQNHNPGYESWVGESLGRCLVGGGRIVIGTLQQAVRPEEMAESVDRSSLFYSDVTLAVNEWVAAEPQRWKSDLELDKVPFVMSQVYGSQFPGAVWRNVDFKVGGQLLVAFYPDSLDDQATLTRMDKYYLVLSDEGLFPAIRNIVAKHILYQGNGEEILDAPKLLDAQTDSVFLGYLFYYLRVKGGYDYADTDAIVLSQLIGSKHISEAGWRMLVAPLTRVMSNTDSPVSEAAISKVTETLVITGCSENLALAGCAIGVLVELGDSDRLNMKPFLTERRRQMLLKNYRALVSSRYIQDQAEFESQINLEGSKLQ